MKHHWNFAKIFLVAQKLAGVSLCLTPSAPCPSLPISPPSLSLSLSIFLVAVSQGPASGHADGAGKGRVWWGEDGGPARGQPGGWGSIWGNWLCLPSHTYVIYQVTPSVSKLLPMCKIKWFWGDNMSPFVTAKSGCVALCCFLSPELLTLPCSATWLLFVSFSVTRVLIIFPCLYIQEAASIVFHGLCIKHIFCSRVLQPSGSGLQTVELVSPGCCESGGRRQMATQMWWLRST